MLHILAPTQDDSDGPRDESVESAADRDNGPRHGDPLAQLCPRRPCWGAHDASLIAGTRVDCDHVGHSRRVYSGRSIEQVRCRGIRQPNSGTCIASSQWKEVCGMRHPLGTRPDIFRVRGTAVALAAVAVLGGSTSESTVKATNGPPPAPWGRSRAPIRCRAPRWRAAGPLHRVPAAEDPAPRSGLHGVHQDLVRALRRTPNADSETPRDDGHAEPVVVHPGREEPVDSQCSTAARTVSSCSTR